MKRNFYSRTFDLLKSVKKTVVMSTAAVFAMASSYGQVTAGGLNFDGVNDYVSVGVNPSLNISSAITVEAWIYPTTPAPFKNIIQNVVSKANSTQNTGYIFPRTSNKWDNVEFLVNLNGLGWQTLSVPYGSAKLNQWHHLAATYDGSVMKVYIDGFLAGSQNIAGTITVNNQALSIGAHPGFTNEYFLGSVDEVRIWERALSPCEIGNNRACDLNLPAAGLAAYYKFNQGILNTSNLLTNTVTDASVNNNTGTLLNFSLLGTVSNWVAGIVSTGACAVVAPVIATASAVSVNVAENESINLLASGGDTYSWTGPNGFTSTLQNPVITFANVSQSGTYTVTVTKNGCSSSAAVVITVAKKAGALNFDGIDDYVSIPAAGSISMSSNFSIETWIRPTSTSPMVQSVATNSTYSVNTGFVFPRTDDGWNSFTFWLNINGVWRSVSAPYPGINNWHHVAATYDGGFMKIYLDGNLVASSAISGTITSNANPLTIGGQTGQIEFFKGNVDEMRIWNRVVSGCEIQNNLYCQLYGGYDENTNGLSSQVNLGAYYRFNQGLLAVNNAGISNLADSSGNGNHGVMYNFGLTGTASNWVDGKAIGECQKYVEAGSTISSNGPIVEVGTNIVLSATGGSNYSWTGPNGFTANTQNVTIPAAQVSNSGTYSVSISGSGCSSVLSANINVAYKAGSLNFDGIDNMVSVPHSASLNIANQISLESWIYPTNNQHGIQNVMGKSSLTQNTGYIFPRTDDGWSTVAFYLHINGSWQILTAPYPGINQWHHLAATYDGFFMRIYIDGILAGTKQIVGKITQNTNNLSLGQQPGYTELFRGKVEEARVWSRALNQCEVINNMTCQMDPNIQTGLAAYYNFNQGYINQDNTSINTLNDISGNANNGSLQFFTLQGTASNWSEGNVTGTCPAYTLPNVTAAANGTIFGVGSNIRLISSGAINGATYTWDGPNNFSSSLQNPVIAGATPAASGVYTVTVPYIKCVITASTNLTVSNISLISANGPTTFCPSGSVTLSATNTGSAYQWYRNEVLISGATANNYVATQSGNYTISITDGNNVYVSPAITITVEDTQAPVPVLAQLPVVSLDLTGVSVSLTQVPQANDNCRGLFNGTTTDNRTFTMPGTYTITWTYNDNNGNIITQTQQVTVVDRVAPVITLPSTITVAGSPALCGANVNFSASATDNAGGPVTITYSPAQNSLFAVGTTTVTVTATDANNNTATGTFSVIVTPTVVAPISGNTVVCQGGTSTLSTTSTGGNWSSSNNAVATVNASGVVTGQAAGTATITYTNACGATASVNFTVNALPATPSVNVTNNCGNSVLSTNATGAILWSTNETSASITVINGGTYTVTQTVNGCVSAAGSGNASPVATPATPVVNLVQPDCVTATGTISISAPVGSGITYSIDGINYQSGNSFTAVSTGTYSVTAKNATGCLSAASVVTINVQPVAPAAPAVSAVQPDCATATGSVTVTAPLGTGFSYSIDGINYQTSASFNGLPAGAYNIIVKNAGGCISAASGIIINAQPATPAAPIVSVTQPDCAVATGAITVNTVSGLTYSINGSTYQSGASFGGLAAGTYTITAKNASGCVSTASIVTVNAQPATPAAPAVSVTQPDCVVATGVITVNAPVGAGITYTIDGINYQSSAVFSGLAAGTYSVIAKSAAGCIGAAASVTITVQPVAPVAATVVATQPTCAVATGSVTISSPLGTGISYSINGTNYQPGAIFNGLIAGTYTVTVKSPAGCISTGTIVTINAQPATPAIPVVSVSQPDCVNATGTVTVNAPNGTGVTYSIDGMNYQSANTFSELAPGTYSITAKNASGCVSTGSTVTVNAQPATPAAPSVSVTQPDCAVATGTITVNTVTGLTYSINGTTYQSGASFSGLAAGNYTITAKNASGCVSTGSTVTVNAQPATPAAPTVSVTQPDCAVATGTITVNTITGLTYSINGTTYQSGASFSGLAAGTYTITAKNASGCVSTGSTVTVNAQPATPAAPSVSVTQPDCAVATGTITVNTVTGLTYSINGTTYQSGASFSGLTAGTYTVTAKNASGCVSTGSTVTVNVQPATPAAPIVSVTQPTCAVSTGSIAVSAVSGSTYSINGTSYQSGAGFTGLPAGTYTVTVKNAAGCVSNGTVVIINAQPVTPIVNAISGPSTVATGASITLANTTVGGVWGSSNPAFATVSASGVVTGIAAGSVTINYSVSSPAGCTAVASFTVTVSAIPTCTVLPVASITASSADAYCNKLILTGSANAANATYKWMSGTNVVATTQTLSLGQTNSDGIYQLYVTANGCTSTAATYNFQKQNLTSSYTILASSYIQLGANNTVASGSVGVTSPSGYIILNSNSSISSPGSFVKSPYIGALGWGISVANPIYSAATNINLPVMYYNTQTTSNLTDATVNERATVTLTGNYKKLNLKKGSVTRLTGTNFGEIKVEQGASVTFAAATVNIGKIQVSKGPRTGYSYVRFEQDTKVLVSNSVTIGSNVFVNPDNNNVTFYMGDNSSDLEKFSVKGGDTRVNANIYSPKGQLKVTGGYRYGDYGNGYGDCDSDDDDEKYAGQGNSNVYMTGIFIADQIIGYGKNVIWNSFDCGAAPVPVINYTPAPVVNAAKATQENSSVETSASEELKVTVMPNPSTTHFTLKFESKFETPVNMRVMDANGRVVDAKSGIGANSTIQIGASYTSGTYYAEMTQGAKRKVVQLIKVRG